MIGLPYDFTDKEISHWGGLRLIEETYRRSGLKQYLEKGMASQITFSRFFRRFDKEWFPIDDGYWTASFEYQGKGWSKPRRMVVVRKDTGKHPDTGGNFWRGYPRKYRTCHLHFKFLMHNLG